MYGSCTHCQTEEALTPLMSDFLCDSCYIESTHEDFIEINKSNKTENEKSPLIGKKRLKEYRNFLFQRDPNCKLCLQSISNRKEASIDHIIPKSLGGTNDYDNLQLAHRDCNSRRGNKPLD